MSAAEIKERPEGRGGCQGSKRHAREDGERGRVVIGRGTDRARPGAAGVTECRRGRWAMVRECWTGEVDVERGGWRARVDVGDESWAGNARGVVDIAETGSRLNGEKDRESRAGGEICSWAGAGG